MIELSNTQKKALDIYHNEGHAKAWNYWRLMGNTYGIFLGEVTSNGFIDGESLANHIGLTEGVLCNVDKPWLKFILDGNIIYVAKKPLMHSVSWDAINSCGAVFENEGANIDINSDTYDITLLRGFKGNIDSNKELYGFDKYETHNSEWNRLMYPIHSGVHTDANNPSSPSIPYVQWASHTDRDLGVHYTLERGTATWVQETQNTDASIRFLRGSLGVTYVTRATSTAAYGNFGWRPALRIHLT